MNRLIVILFMLFFPLALQAEQILFVCELYPPYEYIDKGQLQGFEIEVIKEACKRMHVEPVFRVYPWNRAIHMVKTGQADAIFSLFKNSERLEFLYYPAQNISYENNIIIAREDWDIKISKVDDLQGLSVGVISGYTYGKEFEDFQEMTKEECNSPENLLYKLVAGRMDVAIINDFVFRSLRRDTENRKSFKILFTVSSEPLYVAFSREKGPDLEIISNRFGDSLHEMKTDGTYKAIIERFNNILSNTQFW